ncbi:hypothetical protein CcaverHIS002_0404570 [Cutaneotrichosporon cavernicola]|uniref:Uncharacterized protein n=1 Tax=Cutaneotrichosporon cavernicola TaxID=279322 RepID=A0AA48QVR7_9TREE|nr:uncharacterized protein CcaverHIS019_0404540 [Cutaneotrichosporon cavernicola]BEI83853.1 hypothetical protein CcaverHIS002_0404570 [Cutaneotrichosporon cavernicola]BEI91634.1 hypothetical protein CcaverHIS019_0404540 [Cutaneotrichosporon cavernicola]BEI99410.1 hypothetical protein CcaverHIS631_0404530 [Cutaneotrichosporon cavernicola]BEJ07187.1 hypothetical protein CcaverHIS641_0404560 [Cutaneotrichosporon cavernicola]
MSAQAQAPPPYISSAKYFAALTAVSVGAMAVAFRDIGAYKPSVLDAPTCLEQPWVVQYPIATPVNNLLCTLNTFFASIASSKGGVAFVDYFGGVFLAAVLVTVYEGFRPSSRRSAGKDGAGSTEGFGMRLGIAQLSTIALAVGQVITAGIALPAYYTLVSWSTPRHWRKHHHKIDLGDEVFFLSDAAREKVRKKPKHSIQYNANVPRSSYLYTTLVSTLIGFVLPSVAMKLAPAEHRYDVQSAWQIFPAYMLAINITLPPLLRKGFSGVTPLVGIVLVALLGIAGSLRAQYDLYTHLQEGTESLKDIFTVDRVDHLSWAAHRLLVTDFVLVTLAAGSKVLLALARRTRAGAGGKTLYAIILLASAVVIGPGASIMAMWAYGEVIALRDSREYTEAKEAKEVQPKVQ